MTYTNAVAVVMSGADGLIDKLELETKLSKNDRAYLAAYQAKLAAGDTTLTEDLDFLRIFEDWIRIWKQ